jgi:hypothetical protein
MNHFLKILVIFSAMALLAGCDNNRREPETKGIKIGELAPTGRRGFDLSGQFLRTTNIDIITYELPVDKIADLNGIWQTLDAGALRYTDAAGFAANGLRAGTSGYGNKNRITTILKSIGAEKLSTTSLLIQNGQVESVAFGWLNRKTAVSYIGQAGKVETAEVGPAVLALQVYARQLPIGAAERKLSRIQVTPAILASMEGLPAELAARMQKNDLRIHSAGFGLDMKPGDIILLAPNPEKISDATTAAGMFLTKIGLKPMVRVLLFVCTSIT